jgi:hypothetical protein
MKNKETEQVAIWNYPGYNGKTGKMFLRLDHFYVVVCDEETLTLSAWNLYFPNHQDGY